MLLNIKDPSRLFTVEQAEKERYMHAQQKWGWGKNAEYFFPWHENSLSNLAEIVAELKPLSILDYGCGQGYALNKLADQFPNVDFYNYDAFVDQHSAYPTKSYDLIVSNNVLHHIEDQFYDQVVLNLYNLCNHIMFIKLYLFENYKSAAWYEEKYSKLFKIEHVTIGDPIAQEVEKSSFLYGIESYTRTPLYLRLSK